MPSNPDPAGPELRHRAARPQNFPSVAGCPRREPPAKPPLSPAPRVQTILAELETLAIKEPFFTSDQRLTPLANFAWTNLRPLRTAAPRVHHLRIAQHGDRVLARPSGKVRTWAEVLAPTLGDGTFGLRSP